MARKITHTKRGTVYNGVTGRRKVSEPLGSFISTIGAVSKSAGSSSKKKSSVNYSSSLLEANNNYSEGKNSKAGCFVVFILLLLFTIGYGALLRKCSSGHKHHRWQHPERYKYKRHNIFSSGKIANPWNVHL